jgi:ribosomal protein S18 acetylase RimI-like enzyme
MAEIRAVQPDDLGELYRICLATGAGGDDASALYQDSKLLGHVYAAPYAMFSPQSAFVVEDAGGVSGYIVGAPDTHEFEARLEAEWWPALRRLYPDPVGKERAAWSRDQLIAYKIHHPDSTVDEMVEPYPSHLHINLLPHLRGTGIGRRLMERWLVTVREMGSRGAHLAVGGANRRAIRFYRACGFHELKRPSKSAQAAAWFGIDLRAGVGSGCARGTSG